MALNLPEKDFLTAAELAERWGKDENYILHLIDTGKLPAADLYAAKRGKRLTFFQGRDEPADDLSMEYTLAGGVAATLTHPVTPEGEDLIVECIAPTGMSLIAAENACARCAEETGIPVVRHVDIVAFEAAHTAPTMTDTEQKRRHVIQRARELLRDGVSLNAAYKRISIESPPLGSARNVRRIYEDALEAGM